MSDITQADICRYYGGLKPVNGLSPPPERKSARIDTFPACSTPYMHGGAL